jgi:hypothetical protein
VLGSAYALAASVSSTGNLPIVSTDQQEAWNKGCTRAIAASIKAKNVSQDGR